jgi:3-isopropylmalate/(R)-2-methylmalate dehydratase small subunit
VRLPDGRETRFPIEAFARYCLLNGVDELGFLLSKQEQISAYERRMAS